jgi:hypothetical protein
MTPIECALIAIGGLMASLTVIRLIDWVFGEGSGGIALAWAIGIPIGIAAVWQEGKVLLTVLLVIIGGVNPERF